MSKEMFEWKDNVCSWKGYTLSFENNEHVVENRSSSLDKMYPFDEFLIVEISDVSTGSLTEKKSKQVLEALAFYDWSKRSKDKEIKEETKT